jgi:alpha-tubulin suppressor-like RCC1 family protein
MDLIYQDSLMSQAAALACTDPKGLTGRHDSLGDSFLQVSTSNQSGDMTRQLVTLAACTIVLLACSSGEPAGPRGPSANPAAMLVVSGDEQAGMAGQELADPLVVEVVDSAGEPVEGQLVNFVVTSGGGSVFAGAGITNAQGIVQERWTLGSNPGDEQRVEARAVDTETGERIVFASFRAVALLPTPLHAVALSIESAGGHVCALEETGALYCWGDNYSGQLGAEPPVEFNCPIGMIPCSTIPLQVSGGLTFVDVSAGHQHTCGRATNGSLYCWGDNMWGQLGDGTTVSRPTPAEVIGGLTFTRHSLGRNHSCGITGSGEAYCWVDNGSGQLGGAIGDHRSPVRVASPDGNPSSPPLLFTSVSGGAQHTCGTSELTAYCWGAIPNSGASEFPAPVSSEAGFTSVNAATFFTCGVGVDEQAYCWGGNEEGQLGDGTRTDRASPHPIPTNLRFTSVVPGYWHTCGLTADGTAYCWGRNEEGQLGDGTRTRRLTPTAVQGDLRFTTLDLGGMFTCGIATSGIVYCWGGNLAGQLGNATREARLQPTPVHRP